MNLSTVTRIQVVKPGEFISDSSISVSPNRKWIVYELDDTLDQDPWVTNRRLVIADAQNQVAKTLPKEKGWTVFHWLDNQRLAIEMEASNQTLILNPFTGERKVLQPDFPGLYALDNPPNWDGWGETVYDPTLSQVVYLQGDTGEPFHYVLWDMQQKKQLASFDVAHQWNAAPRWSPDGKQFAVAPAPFQVAPPASSDGNLPLAETLEELYSVDSAGKITKLTHLLDYYARVYIDNFSWSPDGNSIAFWYAPLQDNIDLSANPLGNRYLAILDTTTGWVTNTCIRGESNAPLTKSSYPAPLWSPDSRQIVVQSQMTKLAFQIVLVDVPLYRAFKLGEPGESLAPVGWLTTP